MTVSIHTDAHTENAMIEQIYADIHELQLRVFGALWPTKTDELVAKYTTYIIAEAIEALNEVNFKAHKTPHPVDMAALQEESIDIVIFAFAQAGCLFPSYEAFIEALNAKVAKNKSRNDWSINTHQHGV